MQLFSRANGRGEAALIILHGLLGSSANWQTLAKRFGESRTVYTLDMRNHGRSLWVDKMDYPSMAKDILTFIESCSHSHVSVLGHSMGGKAAMQLALDFPDSLDALIVADIAPVHYRHDFYQLLDAMLSVDLTAIENRAEADLALKIALKNEAKSKTDKVDSRIRAFLLHNLALDKNIDQWVWRPNIRVLRDNMDHITNFLSNDNKQFSGPTLFVHGDRSAYVSSEHKPTIKQYFPHAQLSKIEHAGHWLHAEQPQAFFEACENFLSKNS